MQQPLTCENAITSNPTGTGIVPAGGIVQGTGIAIRWQDGPLGRDGQRQEPNGAFVEGVILAALQRIEWYQTACDRRFACRENALAITKLEEALHWLNARTNRRKAAGTEGTHAPDAKGGAQ